MVFVGEQVARQRAAVGQQAERPDIGTVVVDIRTAVAKVLVEGHTVGKVVPEFVARRRECLVVIVLARLAGEAVAGDLAIRIRQQGAFGRQEAGARRGVGLLIAGEDSQRGVVVGLPGQRRRQIVAVVLDVVGCGVAVACQTGESIEHGTLVVQRTTEVERQLAHVETADLCFHFMQRLFGGTLADHVDHAARGHRAVDHG